MDPDLLAAYETCRRMHKRHDPTYYWATRRLPAAIRPATHALYGYVRMADEIVDGTSRPKSARSRSGTSSSAAMIRPTEPADPSM